MGTRSAAPSPDPTREDGIITWGALRGILGSLGGLAVSLFMLAVLLAFRQHGAPSAGTDVLGGVALGFIALLPGACPGIAVTWQCRRSWWRCALAAVGPALALAFALGLAFLVLIGFQAHADWGGYVIGSAVVFAVAGAIAAVCIAPALRLGSSRAVAALTLTGAVAFMLGGLVHGGIVSISASGSGSTDLLLVVPVGFAVALVCGWGGLGGGAQRIQARARESRTVAGGPEGTPRDMP